MSGKVKLKEIRKITGGANINEMFEEMMGLRDASRDIVVPKMVSVINSIRKIIRVLEQFSSMMSKNFSVYQTELDQITTFAAELKLHLQIPDADVEESRYADLDQTAANAAYKEIKLSKWTKTLIVHGARLKPHAAAFTNPAAIKENFVNTTVGLSFTPFTFSNLDFKKLWVHELMTSAAKKYTCTVLATLYSSIMSVYNTVTSPDVEISEFTNILINSIAELKKHPKLSRCTNAFRRIEESVNLLRDNFNGYYRDSIASENPDMLVMNFIVDVSNRGGVTPTLAREFRVLIQFIQESAKNSGKSKDPQVRKMFEMLNSNFSAMEKDLPKEE